MSDIFAIADIRYEILRYLDHFTLMRACCCKDWLATAQHILNAVTHIVATHVGYIAACPNLVSIKVHDDSSIGKHLRYNRVAFVRIFPNIRTIEYVGRKGPSISCLRKIFTNIKNIILDCTKCSDFRQSLGYYILFDIYRGMKIFTIVDMDVSGSREIQLTLTCCKRKASVILASIPNFALCNCTRIV
jgi:hypothetical protein